MSSLHSGVYPHIKMLDSLLTARYVHGTCVGLPMCIACTTHYREPDSTGEQLEHASTRKWDTR